MLLLLLLLTCNTNNSCLGAEPRLASYVFYGARSLLQCSSTVTCGGLSIAGAASAVSSSSHITRVPQPSRDVRRLASRRLQHETDRQ